VVLLLAINFVATLFSFSPAAAEKRSQYKVVRVNSDIVIEDFQKALDKNSNDGWELVAVFGDKLFLKK
jgi:ABC-type uncharacterized transport system substrate-binding protein